MQGEQATVGRSKDAFGGGVLDHRGKIRILPLDTVGRPVRATPPSASSVGQLDRERVGKRTSELHHVLRRVHATVQQDHARPPAQAPIANPRAVSGDDRPRRNDVCSVPHDYLAPLRAYSAAQSDMDSSDYEVQQRAAAGRREVDPPMQVAIARWLGSWIGAGRTAAIVGWRARWRRLSMVDWSC